MVRSPRVRRVTFPLMPAAYSATRSVQALDFEETGLLIPCHCLVCDSCSSGQCFAFGFLQIPPRGGHPCRSANRSPCRAGSGLSPPSLSSATTASESAPFTALRAMPGAREVQLWLCHICADVFQSVVAGAYTATPLKGRSSRAVILDRGPTSPQFLPRISSVSRQVTLVHF